VVDYNESAIKFYEKNNFSTLKKLKNHYSIFEKSYDAYTLYKDITPKPVKAEDNEKRSSGNV